jgi:uncharacterized membrane protein
MSENLKVSNNHFEKLLKISLILGIIVVSGFIIYFILTPEPGFITFGILNENQEAGNYQTEAAANETVSFFLTVGNFSLNPKEVQIYGEYNISFSDVGENQIIIAELWQIKHEIEEYFNILYLRLNITS